MIYIYSFVVIYVQKGKANKLIIQCEKHSKKEQAVEKLRNGAKFDDVAREFSEDKARQGTLLPIFSIFLPGFYIYSS